MWALEAEIVAQRFESTWNILETGAVGVVGVWIVPSTLMVEAGEETGEVSKLRVESLAGETVLPYGPGVLQLWFPDMLHQTPLRDLANQITGPHSQIFWFSKLRWVWKYAFYQTPQVILVSILRLGISAWKTPEMILIKGDI